jgi:hypothetical protein
MTNDRSESQFLARKKSAKRTKLAQDVEERGGTNGEPGSFSADQTLS